MNRKTFLKSGAVIGAAAALPKWSLGAGAAGSKIKVALVGCGSRGTGVLTNMIAADQDIEIVALGDLFSDRIDACIAKISEFAKKNYPSREREIIKISPEKIFLGMDAIDKVLQTDADVVALATPPCFRTGQIEKCLKAGKHVFAEKPICIDAVQLRKIYHELIPLADSKKLSVVCGTQMRYNTSIKEAVDRIRNGQIGEIVSGNFLRFEPQYLLGGRYPMPKNLKPQDVEYQIRSWLSFIWTSGDQFVEQYIHNLDIALWAFGELPSEVVATGGRSTDIIWPSMGDRFSNMSATYEFKSGSTLSAACRQENGTSPFAMFRVSGTKGILDMSFGRQKITGQNPWECGAPTKQALVCEHEYLFASIKNSAPVNTMKSCADSCYTAIAARESAYSGKRFKCAWIAEKSQQNLVPEGLKLSDIKPVGAIPCPGVYKLS